MFLILLKIACVSLALFLFSSCNSSNTDESTPKSVDSYSKSTTTTTEAPNLNPITTISTATPASMTPVTSTAAPSDTKDPKAATESVNPFLMSPDLCNDNNGPNCSKLPLGDGYLTTTSPAQDYLYSCSGPNPNAPGANESKINWIDFNEKTWNFFEKLWLPSGVFSPGIGLYLESILSGQRQVQINNLPVDGKIGDWPMTQYPQLTVIDRNPGVPAAIDQSFSYTNNPTVASSPNCVSLGAIGVTKNGVVLYNASDARGEDALAREIVDIFGGHPAKTNYHYHFIPFRLDNETLENGHSGIVGYINDGFPIYGYNGVEGKEMSNEDLDECHGHNHGTLGYHYHATIEYPYTIGCYKGTPTTTVRKRPMPSRSQR